MDKVPENYTEAWGHLTQVINQLVDKVNELDGRIPKRRTPEELRELRIESLKKARDARGN